MWWITINIIIAIIGIVFFAEGLIIGQKSEAYDCFLWLAIGVVLFLGAGISGLIEWIWF